jgi:hypothetical protein
MIYVPYCLIVYSPHESLIENPAPNTKITFGDIENYALFGKASLEIDVTRETFVQRHFEEVFVSHSGSVLYFWGFDPTTGYQPFLYKMDISEYAGNCNLERVAFEGNMMRTYWGPSWLFVGLAAIVLAIISFLFGWGAYKLYID